jgi:hypothetical protein
MPDFNKKKTPFFFHIFDFELGDIHLAFDKLKIIIADKHTFIK